MKINLPLGLSLAEVRGDSFDDLLELADVYALWKAGELPLSKKIGESLSHHFDDLLTCGLADFIEKFLGHFELRPAGATGECVAVFQGSELVRALLVTIRASQLELSHSNPLGQSAKDTISSSDHT